MYFDFANVFIFLAFGAFFVVLNVSILSRLLRPTVKDPAKETTYECGEPAVGSGWVRFDIRFYTVALVFLIFDVEVAFLYPWAVLFKEAKRDDQAAHFEVPVARLAEAKDDEVAALIAKINGGAGWSRKTSLPGTLVLDMDRAAPLTRTAIREAFKESKVLSLDENGFLAEGKLRVKASGASDVPVANEAFHEMGAAPVVEATSNEATSWLLTLEEGRVRLKDVEEAAQRSGPTAQVTEIEWVAGPPWRFPFFLFAEMLVFIGILLVGFVYIWVKGDLSWIKTTDNRAAQAADAARARELAGREVARG